MTHSHPSRRALLAALGASLLPSLGHAADAPGAWRSSYTPYNGPLKPPLASGPLPVQGRWPAALQGSFYRIGPARRELGGVAMDHWFDGDGMLQAFRLEAGSAAASPPRIAHRGALLTTPKLVAEEAAGRLLYSGFATALPDAPPLSGPDSLNPANINLLALPQTGSLYALWEAGSALEVDPATLQARGFKAWSPETRGAPFSAHPRAAPDGTVWNFGYVPGTGKLLVYEIAPTGQLRRQQVLDAPQADMVHDFAITERYLVFLLMPMKFDGQPGLGSPLPHYRWLDGAPLVALLVDKADWRVQRFELAGTGLFHLANAWEERGTVQVRFVAQPEVLHALRHLNVAGAPRIPPAAPTQWAHLTLYPSTSQAKLAYPGLAHVEFPRIHPARNGLATRFTTLLARSAGMDAQVHGFDTVLTLQEGGRAPRSHCYGAGWIAEEHVYIPTHRGAAEGQGWVLGTAYHWPSERTTLSVFDARAVDAGPLASATLPYGLPLGLHGQFVPA